MGNEMRDYISALPDDLIQKIFSFVEMKVAVSTSLLSTRWRNLWRSVSNINLSEKFWVGNFVEFGNELMQRNYPPKIFKFCLKWNTIEDYEVYVSRWLDLVLKRQVDEVHLKGMVLKLQFLNNLGSLKILKLKKLMLLQEFSETVECNFKSVECLMIVRCEFQDCRRLIIHAPKLKQLTVDDRGSGIYEMCVRAPNLEVLQCEFWSKLAFLVDMPSLCRSHIGATLLHWVLMGESWERKPFALRFKDILAAIRNTRVLTLYSVDFQILLDMPNVYDNSSISFHNLRSLKLTDWSFIENSIPNILDYFPFVETLVLQRIDELPSGVEKGVLEGPELSPQQPGSYQLKCVEIQNCKGCNDEFMLLSSLIDNANRLERVTLTITGTGTEERKQLTRFRRKLLLVPRLLKCSRESSEVVIRLYQRKITGENLNFQKRCGCLKGMKM